MNVLIFGNGFVSSNIKKFLSRENTQVQSLSAREFLAHKEVSPSKLFSQLTSSKFHLIICAGITRLIANDLPCLSKNINLVLDFLLKLNAADILSVTYMSSIDVYGTKIDNIMLNETHPTEAQDYYSLSKIILERSLEHFCLENKLRLMILRLSGVYGPGDEGKSTIHKMQSTALALGSVKVMAPGLDTRDFVFVNDISKVVSLFLNQDISPGVINLSTGTSHSILEIAQVVAKQLGAKVEVSTPANSASNQKRAGKTSIDVSKLRNTFPQFAPTPLAEGVKIYCQSSPSAT